MARPEFTTPISKAEPPLPSDSDFGKLRLDRKERGVWSEPQRLNVDIAGERLEGFAGAPFLLEDPSVDRVYALWPQTSRRIDLYGKSDTDHNGIIPDPEFFTAENNDLCFGEELGSLADAETDAETIESYYFSVFENSGLNSNSEWSRPQQLMLPSAQRLGRPTSVIIDDEGRCAIFWRSTASGIVVVTTNLRDEFPQLSSPQAFGTTFVWDEVWVPCCEKLDEPIQEMIGSGVPAAALFPSTGPTDSRILVSWFEEFHPPGATEPIAQLKVAEFDLANNLWDTTTEASVSGRIFDEITGARASHKLLSVKLDSEGNAYLSWSVKEVEADQSMVASNIFAARRAAGTSIWDEVTSPFETEHARAFQVNSDGQCVNTSQSEFGGWSDVQASEQLLFTWTNEDCMQQVNASTIMRRFK